MLIAKPHWLASAAPVGEYLVDVVALEIFLRCAGISIRDENQFVRVVRQDVSLAAQFAALFARVRLHYRPEKLRLVRRLFEDVRHIQSPIRRNEGLGRTDLVTLTRICSRRVKGQDVLEALESSLPRADVAIGDFLEAYRPLDSEGGNYDWLTRYFIEELFELWRRYVHVELYDEAKVFNKLLAAAWRDVQFPTQEEDGRCLEDWLRDRVRKDFPEKIPKARKERQELDLELARSRAKMRPSLSE